MHAKILRSPHAHANIIKIDTSAAEAHPEVRAVVLAADMIQGDELDDSQDDTRSNILATDKVLYKGHAVAAVAASSPHFAEEALDLINVEYEVLDSVTNVEDAIAVDAPVLHEKYRNTGDDDLSKHPNVAAHGKLVIGNIDTMSGEFSDPDIKVLPQSYQTSGKYNEPSIRVKNQTSVKTKIWVSTIYLLDSNNNPIYWDSLLGGDIESNSSLDLNSFTSFIFDGSVSKIHVFLDLDVYSSSRTIKRKESCTGTRDEKLSCYKDKRNNNIEQIRIELN